MVWRNCRVRPTALKHEIGKLKAEFAGYQQDSHELFQAIVDALHEDLNRVKKKPYVPNVEDEGRSDEIVAVESCRLFSSATTASSQTPCTAS